MIKGNERKFYVIKYILKFLFYLLTYPIIIVGDMFSGMLKASEAIATMKTSKDITVVCAGTTWVMFIINQRAIAFVFAGLTVIIGIIYLYQKRDWEHVSIFNKWKKVNPEDLRRIPEK